MKASLGLLVVMNLVLMGMLAGKKTEPPPMVSTPEMIETLEKDLVQISGEASPGGKLGTLYIFGHADSNCSCLEDWPNWVKAHADFYDLIDVKTVFNGQNLGEYSKFLNSLQIDIPLYQDKSFVLRDALHVQPGVIVKVLVDREGRVLLQDSDQTSDRDQKHFMKRLKEHVSKF